MKTPRLIGSEVSRRRLAPPLSLRMMRAHLFLLTLVASPYTTPAQPKTFEVRYNEKGEISHIVDAKESARVVSPSGRVRTVKASQLPDVLEQQLGEATLMVIWNTTTRECRALMTRLQKLSKQWQPKGLSILTVSVDSDPGKYRRFARRLTSDMETIRVEDYIKGTLDDELGKLGITLKGFTVPIYAWFNKEGKVVKAGADAPTYDTLESTAKELMKLAPPAR